MGEEGSRQTAQQSHGPGAALGLACCRNSEQSGQGEGGGEGREGPGHVLQGLGGLSEDSGLSGSVLRTEPAWDSLSLSLSALLPLVSLSLTHTHNVNNLKKRERKKNAEMNSEMDGKLIDSHGSVGQ